MIPEVNKWHKITDLDGTVWCLKADNVKKDGFEALNEKLGWQWTSFSNAYNCWNNHVIEKVKRLRDLLAEHLKQHGASGLGWLPPKDDTDLDGYGQLPVSDEDSPDYLGCEDQVSWGND